ncbi:Activating transcription factor of chaperone [Frankliniella fusca]|uniref:Activating transcription factor of chaperone n=1 Tax=Frankliniella fusca TaxID=407009 RepID=A0AAE1L886_9NEOP|nr:Activating transcription factor of chaperone [Frankliniella fusca]
MSLNTAMEFSFWKEEPLSPEFSGLEEQVDLWQLIDEDVAKQAQSPERDPLGDLGTSGKWLPESPGDSCDSFITIDTSLQARAQLATQILQYLDDDIKDEPFPDWYETKTDHAIFEELPSPTPSLSPKDEAVQVAGARPFAGLCLPLPMTGAPYAVAANPSYPSPAAPAPAASVLVPLTTVHHHPQQQQHATALLHLAVSHHQPAAAGLGTGLLTTVQPAAPAVPLADTQTLLQEFESVFDKVERHGGALTPPQSPPHDIITTPPQHHHHSTATYYPAQPQQPSQAQQLQLLHFPDVQQQQLIREVDEIVRSRVQQDEDASWLPLAGLAPPSPCTSTNSSSSRSSFSCADDSPAPASPETDDPEWLPGGLSVGSPTPPTSAEASPAPPGKAPSSRKRAPAKRKPYAPNVEDKRMRKKEQNKNAATRYRMKKKAEVEEILGEENELKRRNDELQDKVKDLSQEIRYLKNLMRDVFRAKGLIK